jgi:hypothetical protein
VIDLSLLSVMRRWYFRDGLSQRDSLGKVKEFEKLLISWLKREARRRRKERKTVKNLYEDLLPMGYSGSYDRVAAFVRR